MPFALVTLGILFIVTGVRNTYAAFGQQIVGDFTGPNNFTYWVVALGAVGSLGYIEPLKPISRSFMALLVISFVLKNGGVFDKFTQALQSGPVHTTENTTAPTSTTESGATAIKVTDNSVDYVKSVTDLVMSEIEHGAHTSQTAKDNFNTTLGLVKKILPFFV